MAVLVHYTRATLTDLAPLTTPRSAANALGAIASVLAALALALTACGKSYPDCEGDALCLSHAEVCVDGRCRQCRDDSGCARLDACMVCRSNECIRRPGCCKSDLDCPGGRCWRQGPTGECGGQCQVHADCAAGFRCSESTCIPDVECQDDQACPSGQRCLNGKCAKACELATIHFDFDEFAINLAQEAVVKANVACLLATGFRVRIEGHCDERGSDEFNLALGQQRATTLSRAYTTLGVPASQIEGILSYGEEKPVCNESNERCWQQNRRAETIRR
jgi:peptidoglycan-associated lipoprotein